ncbi:MAG: aquaporin [Actinomycetota bacterium]
MTTTGDPSPPSDVPLHASSENAANDSAPIELSHPVVPMYARLTAEAVGSAFLIVAVIGSGIMAETLSPNDVGLQLLENAAATAGALIGLIIMFASVSGAHFNPAVTLVDRLMGDMTTSEAAWYVVAQLAGGFVGVMAANIMFWDETGGGVITISEKQRDGGPQYVSEIIATIGLLLVIHGAVRYGKAYVVAVAVGVWIGGAYFFTSSTSFANPMVSVNRMFSDTFAGIAPASAPAFIAMQLIGALLAFGLIRVLFSADTPPSNDS